MNLRIIDLFTTASITLCIMFGLQEEVEPCQRQENTQGKKTQRALAPDSDRIHMWSLLHREFKITMANMLRL